MFSVNYSIELLVQGYQDSLLFSGVSSDSARDLEG
jgi:hypothetical protein